MSWPYSATAIRVASGRLVDLADFRPEDVLLADIATGLSHQERYCGHCPLRPTVAQHSLAVEHIARQLAPDQVAGDPEPEYGRLSRAALMHDACEAYVSDVSAPAKRRMRGAGDGHSDYDALELHVALAIERRFDCAPGEWAGVVHQADALAYEYESAYAGWSPQNVPAWLHSNIYVRYAYGRHNDDGGRQMFLLRARALEIT